MDIEKLRTEIESFEDKQFSGGVGDVEILTAELVLSLQFPRDYAEFLRKFGSGYVSFEEFIGLGGAQHLDVVKRTLDLRSRIKSGFPSHLLPVLADGGGNYECIDVSRRGEDGNAAIVFWRHDAGANQDLEKIANSYYEWFHSTLEAIRREEAGDSR